MLSSYMVCRASMHSFHRLSILERATDHKCINNCNPPKEMWVGLKCNGLIIFSQRGGASKIQHMCFPPSPPLHPPPPPVSLISSPWFPSPSPPPPSSVVVGRDISGSGAPAGVFSQERGDPSIMTVPMAYLMDQSRGRIRPEHRRQEMTSSSPSPLPRLLWCP
jgi:hypothetical protein